MTQNDGQPDPLRAPSLMQLSSAAVAKCLPPAPSPKPETSAEKSENRQHQNRVSADTPSCSTAETEPEFCLPLPASQAILESLNDQWQDFDGQGVSEDALRVFTDGHRFPVEQLNLQESDVQDRVACELLCAQQHRLRLLDLVGCENLTADLPSLLCQKDVYLPKLETLKLSGFQWFNFWDQERVKRRIKPSISLHSSAASSANDVPENDEAMSSDSETEMEDESEETAVEESESTSDWQPLTQFCRGIESVVMHGSSYEAFEVDQQLLETQLDFVRDFLHPVTALRHLDLSYWQQGLGELRCVRPHSSTLTTLVLYEVPDLYKAVKTICELTSLRFLDISQGSRETGTYPRPVTVLHNICKSLPSLRHLDISSTNLAAQPSADDWPLKDKSLAAAARASDIAGLRSLHQRLDFVGLLNCDNASHYREIPAIQVAGDANEDQILLSLRTYIDRNILLQLVLNETYQQYRFGEHQHRYTEALHLVLEAMKRHLSDGALQIAGSASLFYIIKNVKMNRLTKQRVVGTLLAGMESHMEEQVMVRNCCLSLCQFDIPQELLFDYERAARLLVRVLEMENNDHMTQRIVVFLLNSMACHVEGEQKVIVGNIGAIEVMLRQIQRKHDNGVCDDVMEVGWSFLWNITDETPVNCSRFLNGSPTEAEPIRGLELFHKCYESFGHKRKLVRNMMGLLRFTNEVELVRNMMGLIGNIAEVAELRNQLLKADYIRIFTSLLTNLTDGIEISYNSAGVLAHMCSDGAEAWSLDSISRQSVMDKIAEAIRSWQLKAKRFINYRSFGPILKLVPLYDSPASQHWAVWALANLTTTDGRKYCAYVVNEGGVSLLTQLVEDQRTSSEVNYLAQIVLENIEKWNRNDFTMSEDTQGEMEEDGLD